MALPSSGAISLSLVNTELGKSASAAISMNDAAVRSLAGKSSGAISMSDLRGKSNIQPPTITFVSTTGSVFIDRTRHEEDKNQTITWKLGGGAVATTTITMINAHSSIYDFRIRSQTATSVIYSIASTSSIYSNYDVRITVKNAAGSASITVLKQGRSDSS